MSLFPCSRQAPSSFRELSPACKCQNARAPGLPPFPPSPRCLPLLSYQFRPYCASVSLSLWLSVVCLSLCLSVSRSCRPLPMYSAITQMHTHTGVHTRRGLSKWQCSRSSGIASHHWRDSVPHRSACVNPSGLCSAASAGRLSPGPPLRGRVILVRQHACPLRIELHQSHAHLSNTITTFTSTDHPNSHRTHATKMLSMHDKATPPLSSLLHPLPPRPSKPGRTGRSSSQNWSPFPPLPRPLDGHRSLRHARGLKLSRAGQGLPGLFLDRPRSAPPNAEHAW